VVGPEEDGTLTPDRIGEKKGEREGTHQPASQPTNHQTNKPTNHFCSLRRGIVTVSRPYACLPCLLTQKEENGKKVKKES
jgi:hypothetical protein